MPRPTGAPASSAPSTSAGVHCQSAVPAMRKSYAGDPRLVPATTIASDVCSFAATAWSSCDAVVGEVRADPSAEQVVRDAGQQAGGDAEAGEAERDVGRAAAGRDLEIAADRCGHQVDEGLTGDGDHAGGAACRRRVRGQPAGVGASGAVTADRPGARCRW